MYAMKDGSKTLPYTESKPVPGTTMLLKERHKQQEYTVHEITYSPRGGLQAQSGLGSL